MSQVLNLHRLQQIDTQADRARLRLETVRAALENNAELSDARTRVVSAQADLKLSEAGLREAEHASDGQRIKIEQTESSLYAGKVQNPKELKGLQDDVAALKRHLATIEDQQLNAMLALETNQAAQQEAAQRLATIEARVLGENRHLTEEREVLLKETQRLETERQAVVAGIEADALALYEQLRLQRRGVAVAPVTDNVCSACGAPLTASQLQEIRGASAAHARCPSCSRILYVA